MTLCVIRARRPAVPRDLVRLIIKKEGKHWRDFWSRFAFALGASLEAAELALHQGAP